MTTGLLFNIPEVGGPLGSRRSRKPKDLSIIRIVVHLDRKAILSIFGGTKSWERQIQLKSDPRKPLYNLKN